jgi:biotin-(acetyl-CoA carboxylase) ligase
LTCSLLLRPRLSVHTLHTVTLCVGLAVREALQAHSNAALQLKWPNDIVHQRR